MANLPTRRQPAPPTLLSLFGVNFGQKPNHAPVANPDVNSIDKGDIQVSGNVLTNDTDADHNKLTVANAGTIPGFAGTLVLKSDGSYTYDLDATSLFVEVLRPGQSYEDVFQYRASDGHGGTAITTLTITVNGVNHPPVAFADTYTTPENAPLIVPTGTGILSNDTDADHDPLSSILVTGPAHGILALNPEGGFNYTPNVGYSGVDTFLYKANDGSASSNPTTVTINILAPVAIDPTDPRDPTDPTNRRPASFVQSAASHTSELASAIFEGFFGTGGTSPATPSVHAATDAPALIGDGTFASHTHR